MNCKSCGAPIAAKSNICTFCGTVNDTDLRGIQRESAPVREGARLCPRCQVLMHVIDVAAEGGFELDRCPQCYGIFFDVAELESFVDSAVSHVYRIDHERMAVLIDEAGEIERTVTYVKCPMCGELMNRRAYGARSGVVADTCKDHGIWLDGGELRRILHWAKAGGQLHDQKRKDEDAEEKRRTERGKAARVAYLHEDFRAEQSANMLLVGGLLRTLLRIFG